MSQREWTAARSGLPHAARQKDSPNSARVAAEFLSIRRAGLTLMELLVVISIMCVLAALALPAIIQARAAARRTACQNNLRNIGLALTGCAQTQRRFPASGNWGRHDQGDFQPYRSWVVDILPWIEQQPLYDAWHLNESCEFAANLELGRRHLRLLVCQDDATSLGGGDLSYVVNGGWGYTVAWNGVGDCPVALDRQPIDFNGDGIVCPGTKISSTSPTDQQMYFQTGMFFAQNWPAGPKTRFHTLDDVTDGESQTMLVVENVRTGADPLFPMRNWSTPVAELTSAFLSPRICRNHSCVQGQVDYSHANLGDYASNAGLTQAEGEAPWPSSFHTAGIFVLFADGRVQFLSEHVAGGVYAALVSPQGNQVRGPLGLQILSEGSY